MNDIIDKILNDGLIDVETAKHVRSINMSGVPLDEALLSGCGMPEDKLLRILASEFNVPYMEIEQCPLPSHEFLADFPARILLKRLLLPMKREGGVVLLATSRLFDTIGIDELRLATGLSFNPYLRSLPRLNGV